MAKARVKSNVVKDYVWYNIYLSHSPHLLSVVVISPGGVLVFKAVGHSLLITHHALWQGGVPYVISLLESYVLD